MSVEVYSGRRIARLVLVFSLLLPVAALPQIGSGEHVVRISDVGTGTKPLHTTNSDKVIADTADVLHAVFLDGDELVHFQSIDAGRSWGQRKVVATGSPISPALARDDVGNIGVAFVRPDNSPTMGILYYSGWTGTDWSPPQQLSRINAAYSPSMVGNGDRMHLVWVEGVQVQYLSFPSSAPPPMPDPEIVVFSSICASAKYSFPSIAVTSPPLGQSEPIVRVAVVSSTPGTCLASGSTGIYLFQRPRAKKLWMGSPPEYGTLFYNELGTSGTEVSSLSLSANKDSGYFFLAYNSKRFGNTAWQTWLERGTRSTNSSDWHRAPILGPTSSPIIIDVAPLRYPEDSGAQSDNGFKVAYVQGGTAILRRGSWSAGATRPYLSSAKQLGSNSHVAHAVDFEVYDANTTEGKGISAVWDYHAPGYSPLVRALSFSIFY